MECVNDDRMQTILILGATSPIGAALSEQFSNGNGIVLSARNQARLNVVADRCAKAGAVAVRTVVADLAHSIQPIADANSECAFDLIIDASSASSHSRDPDVASDAMGSIIQADILSHLDLYQKLARVNGKHPNIVFISTVLSIVKTPGREIYSATKRLLEIYLEKMAANEPDVRVLIFRIGKQIDPKKDSPQAAALAKRVQYEFSAGNTSAIYGISGRFLVVLKSFHPAVLNVVVRTRRILRGK